MDGGLKTVPIDTDLATSLSLAGINAEVGYLPSSLFDGTTLYPVRSSRNPPSGGGSRRGLLGYPEHEIYEKKRCPKYSTHNGSSKSSLGSLLRGSEAPSRYRLYIVQGKPP